MMIFKKYWVKKVALFIQLIQEPISLYSLITNHLYSVLHSSEEHDDGWFGKSDDIVPLQNNIKHGDW